MKKTQLPQHISVDKPSFDSPIFIADNTSIVGDVRIGRDSSVWFGSVLRGDINYISIGQRTNIQDGTIIHLENDLPCIVGDDVTVGHRSILHACTIESGCLIGMGAIILNGAHLKKGAIIGAGAVVKEHTVVPENTLWAGVPAVQKKQANSTQYQTNIEWAAKYVELSKKYYS